LLVDPCDIDQLPAEAGSQNVTPWHARVAWANSRCSIGLCLGIDTAGSAQSESQAQAGPPEVRAGDLNNPDCFQELALFIRADEV